MTTVNPKSKYYQIQRKSKTPNSKISVFGFLFFGIFLEVWFLDLGFMLSLKTSSERPQGVRVLTLHISYIISYHIITRKGYMVKSDII